MKRLELTDLQQNAKIHFIGIGGISMSGLAEIMLQKGFRVSGSDRTLSHITERLVSLGADIHEGHSAENVDGADLVVHTAAVHDDNPEMQRAKELGIHLIDRAELLGAVMKLYSHAVGVAGTHGKTTTTSMLAHALINAGLDPTISLGGELDLINGNIRTGHSSYFVTEACEYTNSFLKFFPTIALITNIEEDHLDFFSGIEEIRQSFREFAMLTKGVGKVIAYGEDKNIRLALKDSGLDIITYGISNKMDYFACNITYRGGFPEFDVIGNGVKLVRVKLNVPGNHNILNALATIAVSRALGADINKAAEGLAEFKGTHRRFEHRGELNGAVVIDDYAHHPTEIKATLSSAKMLPHNRIICVFQPHTYTRTKTLWNDFLTAFKDADKVIITDIYAAREQYDGETRADNLAAAIAQTGTDATYIKDFEDIADILKKNAAENDIIFTMGAGTITELGDLLVN